MKTLKALTIGGATLDTIIEYEEMFTMNMQKKDTTQSFMLLEEGAKIEVKEHNSFSGGGATNAAVSFKKQNIDVSFFGKIGKDITGEKITQELKDFGIDISNIRYSNTYGTATSYVIPTLSGDRTIFAYRGANKDILEDDLPSKAIIDSDFIYITSLSKSSAARLPEIVKLASENNTKVAINPGSSQLSVGESFIKDSMFGIDILVLNYQEAQKLMLSLLSSDDKEVTESKDRLDTLHDEDRSDFLNATFRLKDFFRICLDLGVRLIMVTDGANGIYAATKDKIYHSESLHIKNVVNTLGAGDAFSSTFCANIYKGNSIEDSIKFALINASHVIQYSDAKSGLQTSESLERIKSKMNCGLDKKITVTPW
ncbi:MULTISPECIES: carbohydrate kinase family protein [unclassified Francisella]|uniref:carbohydrate kinase family protein n=1 Tax=unclassified Francisella TaxID=2610885 RepID=UPI002E3109EE|nr:MULTISPECIES: carbohydrate kinase family protein [unclassified Francisella]MED7818610.1 carbohydrate kinase family protein [Francisella sp. 19S2-4]MED7829446.1 carbohydrate kinase family protein [Francisella sp. 19S2-10]